MRLDGKVALITGGARGQGAAEARLFVAEGAKVLITDVLDDEGDALATSLNQMGKGDAARYRHHDVASVDDWAAAVAEAVSAFGQLDVLVNNAGIHSVIPIEDETFERFEKIIAVNLYGPWHGMRAALPAMRAAGGGSIVNISSLAGMKGFPGHGSYGASKWALRGLTKTAAREFGPSGIRVNSVHPGAIKTDMLPEGSRAEGTFSALPIGRAGEADEIARLVLFLASDESSYITGTEHVIDGGSIA
ncbi:MAG: 3-alpha-hydroxysteroid dehydrogenase [Actinomycetia bacterium]|nr:3-alpha-hydroxysteroid dehydrogenase [Actinomycetes bacterium]